MAALFRSPGQPRARECGWIRDEQHVAGVSRMRAQLHETGYRTHSHDTYTLSLVEGGVQEFNYRHSVHRCAPGQVSILHPDETHDGRPGSDDPLSYGCVHLSPAAVQDAIAATGARKATLPFVREPVVYHPGLAHDLLCAFEVELEPLFADSLIASLANHLSGLAFGIQLETVQGRLDVVALDRAAEFLRGNAGRVVHSRELEAITGLTRFELATQFRRRFGTSPYRYLLMRRLDLVRRALRAGVDPAQAALQTGFADQSHMGRVFRAALGMTPRQFARLHRH
ncbi:MAG: AraC family transcriptional regulator [Roseateles sp.]|uniref:AraC family transcriptional regulator n=1 Tax=Roseateles sp. TaxID=1971397 RepID=UPI004037543E